VLVLLLCKQHPEEKNKRFRPDHQLEEGRVRTWYNNNRACVSLSPNKLDSVNLLLPRSGTQLSPAHARTDVKVVNLIRPMERLDRFRLKQTGWKAIKTTRNSQSVNQESERDGTILITRPPVKFVSSLSCF